jgi:hypothetical protein
MSEQIVITYADKVFKLTQGQKITFKGGKVMQSDIGIKVVASESVTLISFTVGGVSYQAVEGMKWYEWCNSEYAPDTFRAVSGNYNVYYYGDSAPKYVKGVKPDDVIQADTSYSFVVGGGAD